MSDHTNTENVYVIDTKMFGFERYHAAYLVVGDELALIDTGTPTSWGVVQQAIEAHGFGLDDIAHVFVTHAEHPDHSGNVGALLKHNERALVHVHPLGAEYLTDPAIEGEKRRKNLPPIFAARFGDMEPVPVPRLSLLSDGDVVDLGNGVRLRALFAPGHQPSGIVVFEEKYQGLFINDLCGAFFPDADAAWLFSPLRSDVRQSMASLGKVRNLPSKRLYLGHYGIADEPMKVVDRALANMQTILDIGSECMSAGRPDEIEPRVFALLEPELEKMGRVRDAALYQYLVNELGPTLAKALAGYLQQSAWVG